MIPCRCRHEDCDAEFDHHGSVNETTCCPECGRQQHVLPRGTWVPLQPRPCDLCVHVATWGHPLGGYRCDWCPRPER